MTQEELLDILINVWNRGMSADEAFDEIQGYIDTLTEE